jgi:hypothetical protein
VIDRPTLFHRLRLLAIAAALPGCSLAYDLNLDQCKVDADCASIGQGMICGSDNICKLDDRGCADNAQCIDENSAEAACIKPTPESRRGECVVLKTEQCPTILPLSPPNFVLETLRNEDPLILGVFTSLALSPYLYNYDMALTEVEQANDGLSLQGGTTRKVLMVGCNAKRADAPVPENFDRDLDAAMDHLIKLKVPGVASALDASDLKRVFEEKGHPANMFFMSSQESDRALPVQDDDLLWSILPGGTSLGRSYRPIVERTLAHLQGSGALTGAARIAAVTTPDIRLLGDIGFALQDTSTGLFFNGKTALENQSPDNNYLALNTPSVIADSSADLSEQVEALLAFKPHIIISLGASEFLTKVIPQVESQWSASAAGQSPPFYVLSPYQYGARGALTTLVQNYPIRQRLLGVNAPASGDPLLYSAYIGRFRAAYNQVQNPDGYENFYDSAYYLLYAAAAARPAPTDGLALAAGMIRLLSGDTYPVGSLTMADAFNALRSTSGATITLEGLMGPPKFDDRGGRDDAGSVWCINASNSFVADVLTYDDANGTMQRSFPCFDDF